MGVIGSLKANIQVNVKVHAKSTKTHEKRAHQRPSSDGAGGHCGGLDSGAAEVSGGRDGADARPTPGPGCRDDSPHSGAVGACCRCTGRYGAPSLGSSPKHLHRP